MIKISQLTKTFRTAEIETLALNNISLDINRGEYIAIMGPSGCGKSTLLNILGLLDSPTKGNYSLNNTDVSAAGNAKRTAMRKGKIGFIFQSFNLVDELTVYENIELPLLYLREPKKQRRARVDNILESLNMLHRKGHFPQQLSGGQQQRVAVGRALVIEPELILADEPTGNLDSKNGGEVMDLIHSAHKSDATIVMVTHSSAHAAHAERIINLFDGSIITEQSGGII